MPPISLNTSAFSRSNRTRAGRSSVSGYMASSVDLHEVKSKRTSKIVKPSETGPTDWVEFEPALVRIRQGRRFEGVLTSATWLQIRPDVSSPSSAH